MQETLSKSKEMGIPDVLRNIGRHSPVQHKEMGGIRCMSKASERYPIKQITILFVVGRRLDRA